MNPIGLEHELERRVLIRARPETVFRYFTDSGRWAAWWGPGSTIDPRPGGKVIIRHPNAVEVAGSVLEVDPPRRIVFTYGYASGQPFPVGASRVSITLTAEEVGTRLVLVHAFADRAARDPHVQGWRYQLAVFSNVVADALMADAGSRVDAWFSAWSDPDPARRAKLLESATADGVRFRDRHSLIEGRGDLEPHLSAVHVFMPGTHMERMGEPRHCQGTVLADWVARGPDGAERGRGTNVFRFDADGQIEDVVGIWQR
jgi:uncharacterized protein YndB with AHSA1/START domain